MKPTKIVIEVRGGTIQAVHANHKAVKIVIVDFDNIDQGQNPVGVVQSPDSVHDPVCNAFGKEDAQVIEVHEMLKGLKF
jgi:hypothetical protein